MAGLTLCPPFRPASAANLRFCEKLRFSFGTLSPPFRAIARCFSRSMEAKPRVEFEEFLGVSIASAILSSLELRHSPKDEMFGRDKGFKCPNLRWTVPGFQVIKGIIHAPCAKPALRPESRTALLTAIAKAGDRSTTSVSAASRHEQEWPAFGVRSGGKPAPSLDMAEVPQRARRVHALAQDQS